jgi:hypothetical protein
MSHYTESSFSCEDYTILPYPTMSPLSPWTANVGKLPCQAKGSGRD